MKRWPLYNPHFWESNPFFRLLLPLAAGVFCYYQGWLHFINGMLALSIMAASFLVYAPLAYGKRTWRYYQSISFVLLHTFLFFSGLALSYFNDDSNAKNWIGNEPTQSSTYLVRITEQPTEKAHSWKIPVSVINSVNDGMLREVKGNAFLYLYKNGGPASLQKGDSLWVPGNWQTIKNSGNPFEFDYAAYCRRSNIFYTQFCSPNNIRLYATCDPASLSITERAHTWCMQQLDKYITDKKAKGLVQAMLIGDEINLDEDLRQSYAETGIIHIIAISGGNVTIFFVVIAFLLRWLKDKKYAWVSYLVALPFIWFYILMASSSPSAMRAAVMFTVFALGIIFSKNNNSLNLLFASAFVLLCIDPAWLFAVGFQLSFVAVLSIILFYRPVYRLYVSKYALVRYLWGTVAASIAAEILIAPLVIWYFHTFPLLFIIANVVAFLFMNVVLILGMVIIATSWMAYLPGVIAFITVLLINWFDNIVIWLQQFNPESFHYLMLTDMELLVSYIAIAGIALFLLRKQKHALFTGLTAACALLLLLCTDEWQSLHQHKLVMYNTGKENHIELINGNEYATIQADTVSPEKVAYAVKPAHTAWHAWRKSNEPADNIFLAGDKTTLVLNEDVNTANTFPVDYLLINTPYVPNVTALKRTFTPSLIVLGSKYDTKQQHKFAAEAQQAGVPIHLVSQNGAFVLSW